MYNSDDPTDVSHNNRVQMYFSINTVHTTHTPIPPFGLLHLAKTYYSLLPKQRLLFSFSST